VNPRPYPFPFDHPAELPPQLAQLRREEPVCPVRLSDGATAFIATRHEDVREVLGDPRFLPRFPGVEVASEEISELAEITDLMFLKDGAEHARLRRLVAKAFTPRYIDGLRGPVRQRVHELIDDLLAAGPGVDFVGVYSVPLAIDVISGMLGVRLEDRETYRGWAEASLASTAFTEYSQDDVTAAVFQMLVEVTKLIASKRADLGDDLLSQLISVHDEQGAMTDSELLGLSVTILTAGSISTVAALVRGLVLLQTPRSRWEAMLADPAGLPVLVEELLRLEAAGGDPMRVAKEDLSLGGVPVKAGQVVVCSLTAANRDPAVFADPEAYLPDRDPNPHLVFGHGPHHCLGAALARVEVEESLRALAERLPGLRLAVPPDRLDWLLGSLIPMPRTLPVAW
jgi:cytochrome P450